MIAALALALLACGSAARAEPIKIGMLKLAADCPTFVAQEKGYFAAYDVEAELVPFVNPETIAIAVVSGDLDIGTAAISAGLYNLAGQGELRIIAAGAREVPGFPDIAVVASNRAFEDGMTTLGDLAGRTFALDQIGSSSHYGLGRIAERYGFDLKSLRLLPLQSIPNQIVAVVRGQADAGILPAAAIVPALAYLRGFRRGARDCHDAFADPDGKRRDGPTAPEILGILAKYTGHPLTLLRLGIAYADAGARLDLRDTERQVAWFRGQNMVKPAAVGAAIIDRYFVVPLPEP